MSAPTTVSPTVRMQRLCNKHRILILPEQTEPHQRYWPEQRRQVFQHVEELAEKRYKSYAVDEDVAWDGPWKLQVKERAELLKELASRCRSRREATWRSHRENVAFSRFTSEVTCKSCHKRLWRSEIESSRAGLGANDRRLKRQQEKRAPCRCSQNISGRAASRHPLEPAGLNPIFGHREQESMIATPGLAKELPFGKEPDAVYGLRQTTNFGAILEGPAKLQDINSPPAEQRVRDVVVSSPLVEDGELLLFPFLVHEAKKESGSDWHSLTLQAAFPIREALLSQQSVKDKAQSATGSFSTNPFCWFVANRGSDWRIFGCFTRDAGEPRRATEGTVDYCIAPVWAGSILTVDGALQLLLITDYIFDWARDVYREGLLDDLALLSAHPRYAARTLVSDSDIMSVRGLSPPVMAFKFSLDGQDHPSGPWNSTIGPGCVRDAAVVEVRVSTLVLTGEIIVSFLQTLHPDDARSLCRIIVNLGGEKSFRGQSVFVSTWADLKELQFQGVNKGQGLPSLAVDDHTHFRTHLASYTYINPGWQLVSELLLLAVDETACNLIVSTANLDTNSTTQPAFVTNARPRDPRFVRSLLTHLVSTPARLLSDAIHRCAMVMTVSTSTGVFAVKECSPIRGVFDFLQRLSSTDVGVNSMLQASNCLNTVRRIGRLPPGTKPLPKDLPSAPFCDRGLALVHATLAPDDAQSESSICLFLIDHLHAPVEPDALREAIRDAVEHCYTNHDVYHTTLNHNICATSLGPFETPGISLPRLWNIEKTCGIFTLGTGFLDWLKFLGGEVPRTQGAPRLRNPRKEGRAMFIRELSPWRDPRYMYPDVSTHMFLVYKLLSREKAFWAGVCLEKLRRGVESCKVCAAEDQEDEYMHGTGETQSEEEESTSNTDESDEGYEEEYTSNTDESDEGQEENTSDTDESGEGLPTRGRQNVWWLRALRRLETCGFCRGIRHEKTQPKWLTRQSQPEMSVASGGPIDVQVTNRYELRNRFLGMSGIPEEFHRPDGLPADEWERNLNFYPKLNEKFTDNAELYSHLAEFREYRLRTIGGLQQRTVAGIPHLGKRKRGDDRTSYGQLSNPGDAEIIFVGG
ncbi:hypothetical protein QBC47DRAFT_385270 [Echria macrotheca]|uniref:Uncharacterized protein n=1 Tax=Echria macrotheca TaxID=438768 RepID=A0AAJ0FAA5_9PEZI|nr:hypothetical protein QBC47DRAFT_385270 [Echria macrotheca]